MREKVEVLLSVYNPILEYLEEQLKSLDNQTYDNIEIVVFDDCPDRRCDLSIFEKILKNKKYRVLPYKEKNLGYSKAFEYLVSESRGEYIAFCDQDDIWANDKIEKCVACLKQNESVLVATDRKIIDEKGIVRCESVRHSMSKKYECWRSGDDIGVRNFFVTCAPGMCLVVKGEFVRSTVPFSNLTGHDKWIIACACAYGKLSFLDEPLSYYRRYGKNVTGIMTGINTKKDYMQKRVEPHLKLIKEFSKRYPGYAGNKRAYEFARARLNRDVCGMLKYCTLVPEIVMFDVLVMALPECCVKMIIKILKRRG